MEEINQKMGNMQLKDNQKKNKIQVSNTKNPLFFYVNLTKRYLKHCDEVELSALGKAIATVVTIAEILKNNGLAVEKRILTSTVDIKDETRSRPIQKAKRKRCSLIETKTINSKRGQYIGALIFC
ncbi:uncharacterized protein At2g34160 isoform X2 [Cryptomeria japonica]|uniref:uncharacterized protein At2g34160 isoform X2 n=1 Tax=Cryptomeria japonica TaxID=3369 RepID=UPI0025ABF0E3|nr:uncharacterized protein At2g34160 isoform X2 [Cryptomeria japonica]